ncbi:MAG: alpha-1,2-fucosyltransferase [Lachnospiraceae bacterium]|nr:alpha-1,2-fucosyltransferase [Lachnospiraceae bacterium]
MILLRFCSGLGNQMFQYCFYRYLQDVYGRENVKADLTWFDWHQEHQGFELEKIFGIKPEKASRREVLRVSGRLPQDFPCAYYVNRSIRLFTEEKRKPYILDEIERSRVLDKGKDWYLTGYYISQEYYCDRLEEIKDYFIFPDEEKMGLQDLALKIRESTSVSVHVRRGDYLSPVYDGKFVSLGMDYYKKAAEYILSSHPGARFFVFSDDKDFISENFEWLDNKVIVTGNSGADSYKDMYLMSICDHNITANSTFSTWGALLNRNVEKTVIYPEKYLSGEDSEIKSLKGWTRL